MSRLTKSGPISQRDIDELLVYSDDSQFGPNNAYFKLQYYEDLEEAGRLPSLPCAVGDIIYRINPGAKDPIIPMGVVSIELKGITDTFKEIKCKDCAFGGENFYRFTDIGKTVFLTKAEALEKLEELKGGGGDE